MKMRGILSSTHIDRHNMRMSKEALESMAEQINGDSVPGVGIEHDVLIPPIGKVVKATIEKLPDGEYALYGEQEIFDEKNTTEIKLPNGETAYLSTGYDERPFRDKYDEIPNQIQITYDFVNFESKKDMDNFIEELREEGSFEEMSLMRKSWIPDPEIIMTLSSHALTFFAGHQIFKRLGNQVSDDVSKDLSNLYKFIRNAAFKYAKYCIPKNRPITYVIVFPSTPSIELVIRATNPEIVSSSINEEKLKVALNEAERLDQAFGAQKIQFVYNSDKWTFNFLLTKDGKVVGSKDAMKRRSKAVELMLQKRISKNT